MSLHFEILCDVVSKKDCPILFKCNALPFKCFAKSMFCCSIRSRSFVLHMILKYSFKALDFIFNVKSSPRDIMADTVT